VGLSLWERLYCGFFVLIFLVFIWHFYIYLPIKAIKNKPLNLIQKIFFVIHLCVCIGLFLFYFLGDFKAVISAAIIVFVLFCLIAINRDKFK